MLFHGPFKAGSLDYTNANHFEILMREYGHETQVRTITAPCIQKEDMKAAGPTKGALESKTALRSLTPNTTAPAEEATTGCAPQTAAGKSLFVVEPLRHYGDLQESCQSMEALGSQVCRISP